MSTRIPQPPSSAPDAAPPAKVTFSGHSHTPTRRSSVSDAANPKPTRPRDDPSSSLSGRGKVSSFSRSSDLGSSSRKDSQVTTTTKNNDNQSSVRSKSSTSSTSGTGGGGGGGGVGVVRTAARASFALPSGRASILAANANSGAASGAVPTASSRIGLGIVKRPQQQQSATHDSSSSREPSTSSAGRAVLLSSETRDASSHDVQEMNDAAAAAVKRAHGHGQDVAPLQGSLLSDRSPGDGADAGGFSPTHDPNAATLAGGPPSSFLSSFNTPPNPPAISGGGAIGPAAATAARSGVGADASSSKDRLGFKKLSQEEEDDKERFLESIGLGRKKSSAPAVATAAPPSALPSTTAMRKGHPSGKKPSPQNDTFEGFEDGDPTVTTNAGGDGHGGDGDEPTPLDPSALNLSIETRREGHDESLMHLKSPDVKDPSAGGNADNNGPNAHAGAQPIEQEALSLNRGVSLTVPHPTTGRRAQKEAPNFTCMMSASLPGGASAGHLETVCAGRANGDVVLWRVPSHATKLNASGTSVGAAAQAQALEAATRKAAGRSSSSSMMTSPRGNQQGGSGAPVPKPPKRGSDGQPLLVSATAAAFRSSNDVVGGRAVARAQSDERQGLAHSSATIRAAAHAQIQALADAEALASVGVVGPLLLGSHRGAVSSMTMVSAAGVPLLLTGAADCAITMWDVGHAEPPQKGQRMVQSVPAHDATVTCLAAHCNAIISGSADGVVKIWMFDATRKHLLYPWMLLSQAFVIGAWVTELWASPHKASDSLQGEVLIGDSTGNITALRSIPGTGNEAAPATPVAISGAAATARPGGFHSLEAPGAQQTETPRTGTGGGDQDLTISSKQALSQSPGDTDARSPQGKSSKGHGHKDDSSSPSGGVGGGQQPQQQQQHLICGFELMKQHRLSGGGGAGAARETPISSTTPQSSPLGQGDGGFANGRPAAKAMSGGQFSAQAPAHGVTRIVGIPRLNAVLLLSHGTHAELRDHIGFSILATIKHPNAAGRSGLLPATGSEDMSDPHSSGAPGSSSVQNAMSNTGQDDGQVGGGGEDALASAAIAGTGLGGDHGCSRPGVPTTASTTVSWSQNIAAAATSALSASRFVDAAWLNDTDELMLVDLAGSVFIWSAKTTKLTFSSTRVASAGKVTAAVNGRNGWTWIANRDHIASVAIRRKKTLQKFKGHTGRVLTLVPLSPWCYGQHGHGGGTFGKCPVDTDAPVSYITAGEDNMICFWSESLVIRHQWTHATVIPGAKGSGATLKFIASKNSKGQSYGVGTTAAGTAAGIAQQRRSMAGAPGQSLTRRSSLTQRNAGNSSSKSPRNGGPNGRDDDSDDEAPDVVSGKGARIIRDLMRRAEKEEEDEELQLIANAANVINANGGSGRRHGAAEISAFVLMAAAPWCVTGHENGALKFWPSTSSVTVREPPGGVPPGGGFASPAVSPANPDSFNFNGFSGMMSQSRARDGNTSTVGPQMPTTRHRRPFHISAHDNTISVVGEGRHRRALGRAGARPGDHSPSPDLGGILPLATSSELSAAEQQRLVTSWTYEKWAHVFTGSYDGHFSLWELPEEADLRVRRHARVRVTEGEILCALYDTLNKMYIVGSSDGVISTWLCDDLRPGLRFDKAPPMSIVSGFKTSADAVVSLLHEDTAHSPTGSSSQGNASTPAHGNNAKAKTNGNGNGNAQSRQSGGMGGMHLDGPTTHHINHQNANTTNTPHHHQSINQQSASMLCFSTSDRIVGGGQSPSGVPLPSMPLSRLEDRTKKAQLHLEKLERRLNKAEQRVRRRLNAKMIRRHEREAQKYIGQSGTATPGSHGAHTPTPGHGASSTTGTVAPSALLKHTQQLSGGFGASTVAGGGGGGSVAGFSMTAGTGHATPAGAMSVASTSMSATPQPQMMTTASAKQMGLGQQSRSNPSGAGAGVGGEKKTGAKKPRAPLTAEDAFLKMASKSGVSVVGADSSSSSDNDDNDDEDSYSSSSSSEEADDQNRGDPFSRHLTHGRPGSSEAGRPFGGASTKSETRGVAGSVSGSPNRDGAARTLSMSRGSRGLSGAGEDEERRRRRQQEEEQDEEDAFFDFLFDSEEEDELLLRREHDTFLAATGRAHGAGVTCIALDANYLFTAAEEETVSLRSLAVKRSDGESHRSKNIGAGKALSVQERDALRIADDLRAKRRRQRQQRHRRNEARQADRQRVLSQWGGVAGTGGSAVTPSAALSGAMSIGSMSAAGLPNHQNPQNQNANPSNVNADATTPAGEVLSPAGVGGATTPEVLMPNPFSMLANALPRGAVVVRVWNAVTYDALPPLRHPRRADGVGDVQALLVLPDSGDVAAGTRTGLVVIFDVAKRVAVKEWQMSSEVSSLAYDRQERELVVALVEGALQRLPIDLMTPVITL